MASIKAVKYVKLIKYVEYKHSNIPEGFVRDNRFVAGIKMFISD